MTIDENGCPTKETLDKIRTFDPFKESIESFVEYLMDNWQNGAYKHYDPETQYLTLSTGGWSGCETIIRALQQNFIFWVLFWYSYTRGGHYEFHFKRKE